MACGSNKLRNLWIRRTAIVYIKSERPFKNNHKAAKYYLRLTKILHSGKDDLKFEAF